MSQPIIEVTNISKKYRLGQRKRHDTLRDELSGIFKSGYQYLRGVSADHLETGEFWALKDINFTVNEGEVLGIIGKNGSGKSTLLKILSRITAPTAGEVRIRGRVASLLEVGTGFSPELTGRENIFLNGAILGMTRKEIKKKFDEIVAFSEIEKFIDTPVKHYSSGMYVRLAFAVAAHLESEILVLDEVLAVGDSQFQKKCLDKMRDISNNNSKTVIFVSHNLPAVEGLCSRAILLDQGSLLISGNPKEIISQYLSSTSMSSLSFQFEENAQLKERQGVVLKEARIETKNPSNKPMIYLDTPLIVTFSYDNRNPKINLNITFHLCDASGSPIFATSSISGKRPIGLVQEQCEIPGNFLNDGVYSVTMYLVEDESIALYTRGNILNFEVREKERKEKWYGKWPGTIRPRLSWNLLASTDKKN